MYPIDLDDPLYISEQIFETMVLLHMGTGN